MEGQGEKEEEKELAVLIETTIAQARPWRLFQKAQREPSGGADSAGSEQRGSLCLALLITNSIARL